MELVKYLISLGWLNDSEQCLDSDVVVDLGSLLDLDLSVSLAEVLDKPRSQCLPDRPSVDRINRAGKVLARDLNNAHERFVLAISNWERGRYRVFHGDRARYLIEQEGFGKPDDGSERWKRTGRMVWLSILEFVEMHFKRARMKMRVAHGNFVDQLESLCEPTAHLRELDDILLRAKLRRLDDGSTWLIRIVNAQFFRLWFDNRPALETKEAMDELVSGLGHEGWLGIFIAQFGRCFSLILEMESDAVTVYPRAFALPDEESN